MKDLLALIGIITIIMLSILCIALLYEGIGDVISTVRYRYKRNHRFDGPPTVKCYCKDCLYYFNDNGSGYCSDTGKFRSDDFFCGNSKPLKRDPEKETK